MEGLSIRQSTPFFKTVVDLMIGVFLHRPWSSSTIKDAIEQVWTPMVGWNEERVWLAALLQLKGTCGNDKEAKTAGVSLTRPLFHSNKSCFQYQKHWLCLRQQHVQRSGKVHVLDAGD